MLWLKQSTAVTVKIGPFVDDSDGKTAETGLTISQGDVRLSKNGGDIAQKNESSAATHDELGIYDCDLDATDTGTLGRLQLWVHESGALPVWHEFMVVTANVWDTLCSTDQLDVNVTNIEGSDATDQINAACDTAFTDYDPPTKAELDSGLAGLNDLTAAEVNAEVDTALADYDPPTKAELDSGLAGLNDLSAAEVNSEVDSAIETYHLDHLLAADYDPASKPGVATALLNELIESDSGVSRFTENALEQGPGAGSAPTVEEIRAEMDSNSTQLAAIVADTNELQTDDIPGTLTTIAGHLTDIKGTGFVKDTDSLVDLAHIGADGDTLESLSDQIDGISTEAGSGAVTWTVTITDENTDAVPSADVWVTSDEDGNNLLASGETDNNGQVTFYLDTGTVYMWVQKGGVNFTNPTEVTIS